MNRNQISLYKKALYGLKAFEPMELAKLGPEDRRFIQYQNQRTWHILNDWKQQLAALFIEATFFKLFPKAPKTSTLDILIKPVTSADFRMDLSFKDLGVSENDIARKLAKAGILPKEFELV